MLSGQAAASAAEMENALTTQPDTTAAAFFDVDNTIMQGASIFDLARGLHTKRLRRLPAKLTPPASTSPKPRPIA